MDYFLARLPIFKRLPSSTLETLSQAFLLRKYGRGEVIFEAGSPPGCVYLLKSGLIKAVKYSPQDTAVIMEIIVPGRLFGMIALMDQKSYPVSTLCIQDSEAYRIRAPDFDELLKKHPDFSREVYSEIGSHLRHSQDLRALAKEPADRRISYILWLLSQSVGKELPIRREDVADMAATTQETAIRVLVDLRKKGLIASRYKSINVLRPARLKAFSKQQQQS